MEHINVLDPYQSSAYREKYVMSHVRGGASNLWNKRVSNALANNSGCQFSITAAKDSTIIAKEMYLQLEFDVQEEDPQNLGPKFLPTANFALRSYPVNNSIANLNVLVNGAQVSCQSSELISPIQRFIKDSVFSSNFMSGTCTQLDPVAQLSQVPKLKAYQAVSAAAGVRTAADDAEYAGTAVNGTFYALENPQSPFIDNVTSGCNDHQLSRGQFPYTKDQGNTKRIYTVTEPLLHPLLNSPEKMEGFLNISNLDISVNFEQDLDKRMVCATSNRIYHINITGANLLYREISTTEKYTPNDFVTRCDTYQFQNQSIGTVAANASIDVTTNTVSYACVPSMMYIYARPTRGTLTVSESMSAFLNIDKISMTLAATSGILSGADSVMLYNLSKQNGLSQLNYKQWHTDLGSVLCLDVAKDLGLVPGTRGNFNLSYRITLKNTAFASRSFSLYTLSVIPGTMIISPTTARQTQGFDLDDANDADMDEAEEEPDVILANRPEGKGFNDHGSLYGGKWYSKVWKIAKKVLKTAQKANDALVKSGVVPQNPYTMGMTKALNSANDIAGQGLYSRRKLGQGRLGM